MNKKCKHFWPLMLIVLMIFACGDGGDGAFSTSDDSASDNGIDATDSTDVTDSVDDTDGGDGYRYLWSTLISTETVIFRGNPLFGFEISGDRTLPGPWRSLKNHPSGSFDH